MFKGERGAEYLPNAILIIRMEFQREQHIEGVLKRLPSWNLVVSSLIELSSDFLQF